MAIGAEQFQVLKPVVLAVAVYVMQGHAEGLATPLGQAALLTAIGLKTLVQKPSL